QSSSVVRASTSTAQVCPLTVSSTLIGARNLGRLARIHDGAYCERNGNPPPIIRRGVQVGQRLDIGEGGAHGFARDSLLGPRRLQRLGDGVEPQWHIGGRADADRQPPADPVFIERNLRSRGHISEIAPPRTRL